MSVDQKWTLYVAYTNTDLTEGRGTDVPIAVCKEEATAVRLAKKKYVQGTDGPVRKVDFIKINDSWYAPVSSIVNVIYPSAEDNREQEKISARRAAIEKAKAAGLTDDDLKALRAPTGDSSHG